MFYKKKCEKLPFVEKEKLLCNFFVLEKFSASTPLGGKGGRQKERKSSYEFKWLRLCKCGATSVPPESKTP